MLDINLGGVLTWPGPRSPPCCAGRPRARAGSWPSPRRPPPAGCPCWPPTARPRRASPGWSAPWRRAGRHRRHRQRRQPRLDRHRDPGRERPALRPARRRGLRRPAAGQPAARPGRDRRRAGLPGRPGRLGHDRRGRAGRRRARAVSRTPSRPPPCRASRVALRIPPRPGCLRELAPGVWFGGSPARVLRLTGRRARGLARAAARPGRPDRGRRRLARRLTDAGLAHPVPPADTPRPEVTVLVPVLDRPAELDRCLAALGNEHAVVVVDDGSADPAAIAAVARRHGARLVRRARQRRSGRRAQRRAGRGHDRVRSRSSTATASRRPAGSTRLLAHLADPLVAAVAPRIVGARTPTPWAGRYTRAAGSLDLGRRPSRVAPGARVSYVPTAALVARRSALLDVARRGYVFDPALRVGEDVDLVWRLHEAGWRVRYDPGVRVAAPRADARWHELLRRRFRYGTSAAPARPRPPRCGRAAGPAPVAGGHRARTAGPSPRPRGGRVRAVAGPLGADTPGRRRPGRGHRPRPCRRHPPDLAGAGSLPDAVRRPGRRSPPLRCPAGVAGARPRCPCCSAAR